MELIDLILALHLLAAAVWTGGHLVLALTVLPRALRAGDAGIVRRFESGYERIGVPSLLLLVLTGFWLAFHWRPDVREWFSFTDPVGARIAIKIVLLALTVGLALHARLRVLPELDAARLRALAWHIGLVTLLAVLLLLTGVSIRLHAGFAAN